MSKQDKHCYFATTLYQESVVPDYQAIIESWHIPALLSPLHKDDLYDKDDPDGKYKKGDVKKAHYHLMLLFPSSQDSNGVKNKFVSIGGVGCEIIYSKVDYARYLCHLDVKDHTYKKLYDVDDVLEFSGANYKEIISSSRNSNMEVYAEIIDYIELAHITSYSVLIRYARYNKPDWFRVLCKNGIIIKDYLKSNNYDNRQSLPAVL